MNWDAIEARPAFRSLLAQKAKFIVPATIFFLIYYLALPVLAFLCGYSYAKRFTSLAHFWLGVALARAAGAWDDVQVLRQMDPRIFRVGDRVRLVAGRLVYLGRRDNEFKISGYRIQPGEVEAQLLALPGVDEACVQGVSIGSVRRLVAFVAGSERDSRVIKAQLANTQKDLSRSRYDVIVGAVRLRQASGTLTQEDLAALNNLLAN